MCVYNQGILIALDCIQSQIGNYTRMLRVVSSKSWK